MTRERESKWKRFSPTTKRSEGLILWILMDRYACPEMLVRRG